MSAGRPTWPLWLRWGQLEGPSWLGASSALEAPLRPQIPFSESVSQGAHLCPAPSTASPRCTAAGVQTHSSYTAGSGVLSSCRPSIASPPACPSTLGSCVTVRSRTHGRVSTGPHVTQWARTRCPAPSFLQTRLPRQGGGPRTQGAVFPRPCPCHSNPLSLQHQVTYQSRLQWLLLR